jgi:methyl-accepting chemotaxis protein
MFISISAFVSILLVTIYYFSVLSDKDIIFAQQEKLGNFMEEKLMKLLNDVTSYNIYISEYYIGLNEGAVKADAVSKDIEDTINNLNLVDKSIINSLQLDAASLERNNKKDLDLNELATNWNSLMSKFKVADAKEFTLEYGSFRDKVIGLISYVGDKSNLILDPELDSYYLMDILIVQIPIGINRIGNIVNSYFPAIYKNNESELKKIDVAIDSNQLINRDLANVISDVDNVLRENPNYHGISPTLAPALKDELANYSVAIQEFANILNNKILNPSIIEVEAQDFLNSAMNAKEASINMWNKSKRELDILLDRRIEDLYQNKHKVMAITGAALVFALMMFFYILNSITKPLNMVSDAMMKLSSGALDTDVPYQSSKDEIGDMARSLQFFKEQSVKAREVTDNEKAEQVKKIERQSKIEELVMGFQSNSTKTVSLLVSATSNLKVSAESMIHVSNDLNSRSTVVTKATNAAKLNVQSVASAAEELSVAIGEINNQINNSVKVIDIAVNKSRNADTIVNSLKESTNKIGEIVTVINNIAGQINLLALNATIESARAGEFGKGFAVVANEVKNLAIQTSKATGEIAKQITGVQDISNTVAESIKEIFSSVEEISKIENIIAAAVEEQSSSTKEISGNVLLSAQNVSEVSDNISTVSQASQEVDQAARKVFDAIQILSQQSEIINREINDFLQDIQRI